MEVVGLAFGKVVFEFVRADPVVVLVCVLLKMDRAAEVLAAIEKSPDAVGIVLQVAGGGVTDVVDVQLRFMEETIIIIKT